jgi:2-phospho-L-lactate/phosphoenolpyruvate guanylyltransferase
VRWTVVIPVKGLPAAKSRLLPASVDDAAHRVLVEAIRADTIAAARSAAPVARVLLVSDQAGHGGAVGDRPGVADVQVLVQTRPGLNAALAEAAAHAGNSWPADGVAALVGDLPALRSDELADALTAAAHFPRAHVRDAAGSGTTLLTAIPGLGLDPSFGPGSAARHGRGSVAIEGRPGLRHDVDTAEDLAAAGPLGLGAATADALARSSVTPRFPERGIVNAIGARMRADHDPHEARHEH